MNNTTTLTKETYQENHQLTYHFYISGSVPVSVGIHLDFPGETEPTEQEVREFIKNNPKGFRVEVVDRELNSNLLTTEQLEGLEVSCEWIED